MQLATSRYHAADLIAESGLVPLGITVGAARWLAYELAGNVGMLAPFGIRDLEGDEFDRAYVERLERFGAEAIELVLRSFVNAYGARGCVLLCFEKVLEGEACHRRTFAAWWEAATGQAVPELGAGDSPQRRESPLFDLVTSLVEKAPRDFEPGQQVGSQATRDAS
jgi:hypothetical protein